MLTRNEPAIFCGVCQGIADKLDIDPILVRLGFVALFFTPAPIGFIYLIMCLIVPSKEVI